MKPLGSSRRAHTLGELLVVLFILSLFALVVIPRFAGNMFRARADAAVNAMEADLGFARSRAVATGVRHQVVLDSQSGELQVVPYQPEDQAGGTTGAAPAANPEVAYRNRLPESVRVTTWTASPMQALGVTNAATELEGQPITFYPEGSSDGLRLILEDDQGNRRGLILDSYTGQTRRMTDEELRQ